MTTEREVNEPEKLLATPDLSDWNPQCQSYERNERSMLYFEGNMSEPSRRSKHQVVFEEEDDEITGLASTMASVSANDCEYSNDTNLSAAFYVSPYIE